MDRVERCRSGDWVEIERVLLEPAERASGLPEATADKPLVMWIKGFSRVEAGIGDEVEIETMTGRVVRGRLSEVNPGYTHTFGAPPPGLAGVGRDLRTRLAAWRAAQGAADDGDPR